MTIMISRLSLDGNINHTHCLHTHKGNFAPCLLSWPWGLRSVLKQSNHSRVLNYSTEVRLFHSTSSHAWCTERYSPTPVEDSGGQLEADLWPETFLACFREQSVLIMHPYICQLCFYKSLCCAVHSVISYIQLPFTDCMILKHTKMRLWDIAIVILIL